MNLTTIRNLAAAASVVVLLSACATSSLSPEAQAIKTTSSPADVMGCKLLGAVTSQPPYVGPSDGVNQLLNNAAVLGADTLLLTSHGVAKGKTGSAYRCAASTP
jgi:hypothetical protein